MLQRDQQRLVNRAIAVATERFDNYNQERYERMRHQKLTIAEIEDLTTYIEEDYHDRKSVQQAIFA